MSKARKEEKLEDADEPEKAPWAVELEFFNKPSFMSAILEIKIDRDQVSVVKDDNSLLNFPYQAIRKILIMQTKKESDLD